MGPGHLSGRASQSRAEPSDRAMMQNKGVLFREDTQPHDLADVGEQYKRMGVFLVGCWKE